MDDVDLLQEFIDRGSESAFRELVHRHVGLVLGVARRRLGGDIHLAQDVTQRVFLVLARKAGSLRGQRTLAGWLHTAACLEAARVVRTEVRRRKREERAHQMTPTSAEPEPPPIPWEQLSPVLDAALAQLNSEDREAVLLRFFSGKALAEVGRALGLTEDTARKRVDRAVEKLRRRLLRRGIASSAAALGAVLGREAAAMPAGPFADAVAAGALRGAAAGSAGPAVALMSMSKAGAAALGTALLFAIGVVAEDMRETRAAARQAVAAETGAASADRRAEEFTRKLAAADKELAQRSARQVRAGPPARAYLDDPAYRRATLWAALTRHHLEFQRFYRMRGLTADQIQKFENIMALQDQANLDAQVVKDQGGDPQSVYRQSGPQWSAEMKALLGEDGFGDLQACLRSRPVRAFVDSLVGETAAIGAPVTPDQADALAATALAHDPTYQAGKGTDPGTVNWSEVWEPAAKILTPEQLDTFRTMVQVWSLERRVSDALANPSRPR